MSDLSLELAQHVVAACKANRIDVAKALTQVLGNELTVGESPAVGTFSPGAPPEGFQGSGLVVRLGLGDKAMVAVIADSSKLVPGWTQQPGPAETSRLKTLAQQLGMLLVPNTVVVEESEAIWLPDLAEGLARAGVAEGSALVTLTLTCQGQESPLHLIWPATSPQQLAVPQSPGGASRGETPAKVGGQGIPQQRPAAKGAAAGQGHRVGDLPPYARHLLKIKVPVMVNLVAKKQTIQEIMELGPGAIVNFEKSCNDPLELMVGNRRVALGSAVKVGDKFGIEITEISLPDEVFGPAVATRTSA